MRNSWSKIDGMMKKLLLCGLTVCLASSAAAQNYVIEGTAQGMDGQKAYIGEAKSSKDIRMLDSVEIKDGTFRMEGKLSEIKQLSLFIGKQKQNFLLDENPIRADYVMQESEFAGKTVRTPKIKITGDRDQELLTDMNNAIAQEMFSMLAISFMGKGRDVNAPENKQLADSITTIYTTAKAHTKQVLDSIIGHYPDSYVSGIILRDIYSKELSADEMQARYDALSQRVKASNIGKDLAEVIKSMRAVGLGSMAPDFTLNDPDGHPVKLSSLRGKCVLIDFWASWCGPCLREAPNVKRVYDKYHDKGFEVLSVSIDEDKEAWVNAIQKHQLTWLHVSSLKGWQCPVARLYQVSGVPAMFLLDRDGRIVSTNARGEVLEAEVAKICK